MDIGQIDLSSADPFGTLLDQMAGTNPQMRFVAELLRQRSTKGGASERQPSQIPAPKRRSVQKEMLAQIRQRYLALRDTNFALAAALGACGNCWGTIPDCPVCSGKGLPGSRTPDENLYRTYVLPAIQSRREVTAREALNFNPKEENDPHG